MNNVRPEEGNMTELLQTLDPASGLTSIELAREVIRLINEGGH